MATEFRQSKLRCPKCGKTSLVPVFDSIDLSESSETTRRMALSGKLFAFQCPSCGKKEPLSYPMSLIDDGTSSMITVLDKSNKKESYKEIYSVYKDMDAQDDDKFRVVDTCQELSEKLRTFEDGLDDRIVEVLKLFICEDIAGNKEELHRVRCIYKGIKDAQLIFSARYAGEKYDIELPAESYFSVEETLSDFSDTSLMNAYMVNQQWADRVVGELIAEED